MFGIGFTELLLIAIIAILFLGPDKLPEAMVQIAKFFKSVKKTVNDAKSSLEEEMRIADLKEEALSYKQQLDSATSELQGFKNISMDDILDEPAVIEEKPASGAFKQKSPYADDSRYSPFLSHLRLLLPSMRRYSHGSQRRLTMRLVRSSSRSYTKA